eukprot:scaffold16436_cov15-Prasinocladus_malaysianus.AAC.1
MTVTTVRLIGTSTFDSLRGARRLLTVAYQMTLREINIDVPLNISVIAFGLTLIFATVADNVRIPELQPHWQLGAWDKWTTDQEHLVRSCTRSTNAYMVVFVHNMRSNRCDTR